MKQVPVAIDVTFQDERGEFYTEKLSVPNSVTKVKLIIEHEYTKT